MSRLSLLFGASLLFNGLLSATPTARSGDGNGILPCVGRAEVAMPDTPIARLRKGEAAQRRDAARWLSEHPTPQAYSALLVALNDPEPDVIWLAASALAKLKNPDALEPMRLAFERYHEKHWMKPPRMHSGIGLPDFSWSINQLMRSASTPTLVKTLRRKDIHSGMRIEAASILGNRRASEAFDALVPMANDRWHATACAGPSALLKIGGPKAVREVRRAYRRAKAQGMSTNFDAKRIEGSLDLLLEAESQREVERFLREGDAFERGMAAQQLGERRAKSARNLLEGATKDADEWVAEQATNALIKMGFRQAVPAPVNQ